MSEIIDNSYVELVKQFNEIISKAKAMPGNIDLFEKAGEVSEKIINATLNTYENMCDIYKEVRGEQLKDIDEICWNVLVKCIDKYISKDKSNVSILDVGTGNGRDMIYGQSIGYNMFGIDKCEGFIDQLSCQCSVGVIKENSYKKCDMRNLEFPNATFDVVRHNATLLHLPLIGKNFTVDLALFESYRVLKPNGLLYIFVKTGTTLEICDTNENLGGRVFQFFSHSMINDAVTRNGFTIIYTSDEVEIREGDSIDWILLVAQKMIMEEE